MCVCVCVSVHRTAFRKRKLATVVNDARGLRGIRAREVNYCGCAAAERTGRMICELWKKAAARISVFDGIARGFFFRCQRLGCM